MTPRHRRRLGVLVGVALIGLVLAVPEARGQGSEDKRADAARIQVQIDEHAERVAALDRKRELAQRGVDQANLAMTQARAALADTNRRLAETRRRLTAQAVRSYVDGSSISLLEHLSGSDGSDLHVRNHYVKAAAGSHQKALEDLRAVREELEARRHALQGAQRAAGAAAASLDAERDALARGEGELRGRLARVQGELGQLLALEQARRNAVALRAAETAVVVRATVRAPTPAPRVGPGPVAPGGIWSCMRQFESSNNYRAGGGGAYQIREPTWRSLGGTGRAEDADPATQDAMAIRLQQRSGWGQWPTVARRCGAL